MYITHIYWALLGPFLTHGDTAESKTEFSAFRECTLRIVLDVRSMRSPSQALSHGALFQMLRCTWSFMALCCMLLCVSFWVVSPSCLSTWVHISAKMKRQLLGRECMYELFLYFSSLTKLSGNPKELKKWSEYRSAKFFFLSFRVVKGSLEVSIICDESLSILFRSQGHQERSLTF